MFLKLSNVFFLFYFILPGEKIGIEYLYKQERCSNRHWSQTTLRRSPPEDEEDDDEGFHVNSFLLLDRSLIYNYIYVLFMFVFLIFSF